MVFAFGLRQTHLFGSFFSSSLFITINGVISICFNSYIITIKKVTRLRVRISKFRIKSIFMVFPSGLRVTRLFRLILLQHCLLLSMVSSKQVSRDLSDNHQKSYKTQSKNFQIQNKVNPYGFCLWSETNTPFWNFFFFNIVHYQ